MNSVPRIQTQCKAIDTLTDGGLATGTITQIFGEKALGKSIISFQTACAAVASGSSAIILDTEQSYASYLIPYWQERMSRRFGKDIPIHDVKLERAPKVGGKKKAVTRGQVISAFSSTLDQLGILYSDSHLGSLADIVSPEFHAELPDEQGALGDDPAGAGRDRPARPPRDRLEEAGLGGREGRAPAPVHARSTSPSSTRSSGRPTPSSSSTTRSRRPSSRRSRTPRTFRPGRRDSRCSSRTPRGSASSSASPSRW